MATALNALASGADDQRGAAARVPAVGVARAADAADCDLGLRRGAGRRCRTARRCRRRPARSFARRRAGSSGSSRICSTWHGSTPRTFASIWPTSISSNSSTVRGRCGRIAAGRTASSYGSSCPPTPLIAITDATRVRQILDGLAENALRVTPEGRPIVLAARVDHRHSVRDSRGPRRRSRTDRGRRGRGIRTRGLYERYRGVRRVGTGLGLALVAGLAARLGGSATAGTSPEGGPSFTIRLPRETVTEPLGWPILEGRRSPGRCGAVP